MQWGLKILRGYLDLQPKVRAVEVPLSTDNPEWNCRCLVQYHCGTISVNRDYMA
jgi:hypothetical protein